MSPKKWTISRGNTSSNHWFSVDMLVLGGVYPKQLGFFLAIARVHPSIRPGSQPQLPVGHSFRGTGRHREDSVRCHEKPNENGQILHFQKKTAISANFMKQWNLERFAVFYIMNTEAVYGRKKTQHNDNREIVMKYQSYMVCLATQLKSRNLTSGKLSKASIQGRNRNLKVWHANDLVCKTLYFLLICQWLVGPNICSSNPWVLIESKMCHLMVPWCTMRAFCSKLFASVSEST